MWWWAHDDGHPQVPGDGLHRPAVHRRRRWPSCGFVNSVVPRDQLEAEVQKYALACAQNRSTDAVFMQKTFFEIMKQFQGEYMGSLLSGVLESMARLRPTRRGRADAPTTRSTRA